jgi:predicted patatin/cPLA2 family phospholipase
MDKTKAPSAHRALTHEEREWVLNDLHKIPSLSGLGRRLLADLVSLCPVYGSGDDHPPSILRLFEGTRSRKSLGAGEDCVESPILAFSIIRGMARIRPRIQPPKQPRQGRKKAPPAAQHVKELHLSVGSYSRHAAGLDAFAPGNLVLEALSTKKGNQPTKVLAVTREAACGSPEIIHRIVAAEPKFRRSLQRHAHPELIWVDGDDSHADLLRPLMHILASSVAQSRPNTAIVELDHKTEATKWTDKLTFAHAKLHGREEKHFYGLVGRNKRGHVFIHRPTDSARLAELKDLRVDRVVYFASELPRALPERLRERLRPEVFDPNWDPHGREPHHGSFLATVPVPLRNPPPGQSRRRFETVKEAPRTDDVATHGPQGLRPFRDACIIRVHRPALRKAWEKWLPHWERSARRGAAPAAIRGQRSKGAPPPTPPHFLGPAVDARAISADSAERWARAVTMRRVGVALSGGGACAYRFVPVLERLQRKKIPVDVFAGLSGGTLLGALYCVYGVDGLRKYVNLRWLIQLMLPLTALTTWPFEWMTDYILGGAFVENLEARLAAVTVALPDEGPPHGAVVLQGTLGEAARVSGTLPPSFAPTQKNGIRYTDGGACTAVPARVARDCGADFVLSCNAIPGPQSCNPYPPSIFGTFLSRRLRRVPPWDRMIDFKSWYSFQWQETSRIFGEEADAFLEFRPSDMSMIESVLFISARRIIADANRQGADIEQAIDRLSEAWKKLEPATAEP